MAFTEIGLSKVQEMSFVYKYFLSAFLICFPLFISCLYELFIIIDWQIA